jgi:hypothetical protein
MLRNELRELLVGHLVHGLDDILLGFLHLSCGGFDLEAGCALGNNRHLEHVGLLADLLVRQRDAGLALGRQTHSVESLLAQLSDSVDDVHRANRLDPQVAVISDGCVSALLELKRLVDRHLLALRRSESLRPRRLPRVVLRLEMFVALRPAESEYLAVVPYKLNAVARINT